MVLSFASMPNPNKIPTARQIQFWPVNGYLFSDAVEEQNTFDLRNTLQTSVGAIADVTTLDLLPSSLDLIDLQDRLIQTPGGRFHLRNPVTILHRGILEILNDYDYILIDCPPNLGSITLNGLRIADGYIIPTIPDTLSTYGIPQIVTRINRFSNEIEIDTRRKIIPLGIVATKYREQANIHKVTMHRMRSGSGKIMGDSMIPYPFVFNTFFAESARFAEAAEYKENKTLRQKWGYAGQYDTFEGFAREFIAVSDEVLQ